METEKRENAIEVERRRVAELEAAMEELRMVIRYTQLVTTSHTWTSVVQSMPHGWSNVDPLH